MELRKVSYPYEDDCEGDNIWYHFGQSEGAVNIKDEDIEEWVNEVINSVKEQLENGIESPYSFRASGNTMVIGFFNQYDDTNWKDADNEFTILVCKNYKQADLSIRELIKKKMTKKDYANITLKDLEELSKEKRTPNLKIGKFTVFVDEEGEDD